MRSIRSLLLASLLASCGGGSAAVNDIPSSDTDWLARYTYRDDNCVNATIVPVFQIFAGDSDAMFQIVVVTPDTVGVFNAGDQSSATQVLSTTGSPVLLVPTVGCYLALIVSEASLEDVTARFFIDAQRGDLIAFCTDTSADASCQISFSRSEN